jgi:spermidine synthase
MAVLGCFFVSGAAALVLQVLWARMLGHVLGASALAVSTVLTVFMGGLALGSHFGGRWAPRLGRPFLTFAALEAAVGLYGLMVPTLLDGLYPLQRWVAADMGATGHGLFRFACASAVLITPTVAMGATLPVLAEGSVRRREDAGAQVGALYAANTFGAVAGTLAAGFWWIPTFGVTATVWLAAGLDLGVAAFVLAYPRRLRAPRRRAPRPDQVLRTHLADETAPHPPVHARWALWTYGGTGAVSMALEVLWTRAIGVVVGSSTYSFTLILAAYLVGLAAGAALVARFMPKRDEVFVWLVALVAGAGLWTLGATAFVDRLPLWLRDVASQPDTSQLDLFRTSLTFALGLTLPATAAFGAVMPLAVDLVTRGRGGSVGSVVGKAYVVNTVGSIVGSFAGGFMILPGLGVQDGLTTLGLVTVLWAAGAGLAGLRRARMLPVAAAGLGVVLWFSLPAWDLDRWTAGLFRMYLSRSVFTDGWQSHADVVYHRDGVATSVTVDRMRESGTLALKVNGKVDASDRGDMPTQILSGLFPILLHPDAKDALVIGYGSGVTPGAVLRAPVDSLTVAEVEARVYEAAHRFFSHVNHRPQDDPRARLVVDDGRNMLLTRAQTYDLVISEPSNPWMTGAASLFTRDFFEVVKSRLRSGGVFLQWVQLYELSPSNVALLLRTYRESFEHAVVLTPDPQSNDVFLVGSRQPLAFEWNDIEAALNDPRLGPELARAGITRGVDLVGLLVGGTRELSRLVPDGPLNTDDNALLEFRAPLDLLRYADKDPIIPLVAAASSKRVELADRLIRGMPEDPDARRVLAWTLLQQGHTRDAERAGQLARRAGADVDRLLRMVRLIEETDDQPILVADEETREDELYVRAALSLLDGNDRQALAWVERDEVGFHRKGPAHRALYAFLCYRNDRYIDAEHLFGLVLDDTDFVAKHPSVLYYAGRNALFRGKLERGLDLLGRFEIAERSAAIVAEPVSPSGT